MAIRHRFDRRKRIIMFLDAAHDLAVSEVEHRARQIMKRHSRCACFCMCMGSATFYDTKGESIGEWGPLPYPKYLQAFDAFVNEFDSELHITGTPMRIVGYDGEKQHDW